MTRSKPLKLSLVIPVYNEEHHIKRCLKAVFDQHVPFDEVIVVDNNCTDKTIEIAQYYKKVKIVKEPKQGLIAARNTGFNSAKGDIICRIDADAELTPNWTEVVIQNFSDPELSGITGLALTSLLPRLKQPRTTLHSRGYFWGIGVVFHTQVLWGATMAIRRNAWFHASKITHNIDSEVHEDQDLSIRLLSLGGKLRLEPKLRMVTHGQEYHYFPKFFEYCKRALNTRGINKSAGRIPVPREARLSNLSLAARWLTLCTAGLLFAITSFIFWPIDLLMLKFGREKTWLH